MPRAKSFVDSVLSAFRQIRSEITIDTVEHDFSPRLGRYFCEEVLGYASNEIRFERNRTDVTMLDENKFRVVLIETKRPREDLNAEKWRDQAGKYADFSTRFVGLANGLRLLLWEVKDGQRQLKIDLNIEELLEQKKFSEEKLDTKTVEQILFLQNITKAEVWNESKYSKFNEYYATIDITEEDGFEKLIDRLNYVSNDLLRQYTYDAFDEYYAGYHEYQNRVKEIELLEKENGRNRKTEAKLAEAKLRTRDEFKKYASFEGYFAWRSLSGRSEKPDEENKTVFCKESIYVLLNRLLFIRICEDTGLLKKRISNGGIEQLRELLHEEILDNSDQLFKQILYHGYNSANQLYPHFFEKGNPLDWYESGDGELNRALNKTLWTLNQFNFTKVDKDILGKIYEKYLPKEERKKLGEFYTPDEVIDYILDAVGYEPSKAIEDRDLIDPACGSGGFLVRATRRLIGRYAVKFGKATPKESLDIRKWPEVLSRLTPKECEATIEGISKHVHGFDINPFAVHITEMNLLFQVIDLYQKARQGNSRFGLSRFQIYQTDSLELPSNQTDLMSFQSPTGKSLAKDKAETDALKKKKYDYVVGNPPYVRIQQIPEHVRASLAQNFKTAKGLFDLYTLFIELGMNLTQSQGKLGYIVSNKFLKADYGKTLRKFLSDYQILEIIDFGDYKVFDGLTNYPLILTVLNSEFTEDVRWITVLGDAPDLLNQLQLADRSSNLANFSISTVSHTKFSEKSWSGDSPSEKLLEKMRQNSTPLGELAKPHRSLYTGLNKAFIVAETTAKQERIEPKLLKNVAAGQDIHKWHVSWKHDVALYPYETGEELSPIELSNYPFAKRWLEKFKPELMSRWYIKKMPAESRDARWFEYADPRSPSQFEDVKIITPDIAKGNRFTIDESGLYFTNTAYVLNISKKQFAKFLLGLLNSTALEFYFKSISPFIQGGYHRYITQYLIQLPIRMPKTKAEEAIAKKIEEKVDALLKIFNKSNSEANQIKDIETEIDSLVFELYGLNDSERKLIEKSVR
ncbi:MAG: N-6 DNA methylase [Candidatus Micrarchaeota archaeon]